jgi:hypothetical protein
VREAATASADIRGSAVPRPGWRLTLDRLAHDGTACTALIVLAAVVFLSFAGGPIVSSAVGHNGFEQFPYALDGDLEPVGIWSHVPTTSQVRVDDYGITLPPPKGAPATLMALGADGPLGRGEPSKRSRR